MKIINNVLRVFAILATLTAFSLLIFFNKSEGELIGSTISVFLSSVAIYLVTYLPKILRKRNMEISPLLYWIILLSILFSMGGGFIFRFYIIFNYYDTIIHFLNGGIIVFIGFAIIKYFVEDSNDHIPFIIFVAVLMSLSLGTLWEIYEFLIDVIIPGSNMQRFIDIHTNPNQPFIGQEALFDTMIDLIVDTLGAILAGLILFMDSIKNKKFINKISFTKIETNN